MSEGKTTTPDAAPPSFLHLRLALDASLAEMTPDAHLYEEYLYGDVIETTYRCVDGRTCPSIDLFLVSRRRGLRRPPGRETSRERRDEATGTGTATTTTMSTTTTTTMSTTTTTTTTTTTMSTTTTTTTTMSTTTTTILRTGG